MARPLTRKTKKGRLYTRGGAMDARIDAALTQDLPTLVRRTRVTDALSPDFLHRNASFILFGTPSAAAMSAGTMR